MTGVQTCALPIFYSERTQCIVVFIISAHCVCSFSVCAYFVHNIALGAVVVKCKNEFTQYSMHYIMYIICYVVSEKEKKYVNKIGSKAHHI